MKSINELKRDWKIEKSFFSLKEIGGLQAFVRDVLECRELFNLKVGYETTEIEKRSNEFTIETSKKGNRADFVIFIKGNEIVIPVEVEKYNNIKSGVTQLAKYQSDWQKAYGILTDGFHWRFYNNTSFNEFTLDKIFTNPSLLKTFWCDYLKEENYYLTFFEKIEKGKSFFNNEKPLKIDDNRELFFEDITKLINNFKNKLDIVGYLKEEDTSDINKRAVEISYAYIIQFIIYKNLVDNCFSKFNEEFSERIFNIYNCLKSKTYQVITAQIYGISNFISNNLYKPFNKEQEFITKNIQTALQKTNVSFKEVTLWLDIIVFIKKYNFAEMQKEIFGYIYENYLKEFYKEKNKGQYFTDPAVVEFMLNEIGYKKNEILRLFKNKQLDKLSIIDPACGSGTFLYSAVNRVVNALYDGEEKKSKIIEKLINENIFGLDIAEFPLYLAEMNILMRMLPIIFNEKYNNPIDKKIKVFKTKDSISEFMDAGITALNKKEIEDNGQYTLLFESSNLDLQYHSFIRDEDDLKEMKQSLRVPRRRFDFVVGNPPYIGYNKCCKQKVLFTQLKEVLMSDIYGVNLNTVPNRNKDYAPKPNLFAFFIALGGGLLKSNAKMCYIIPQTILTSNDLDVIRYYLAKNTTIEKIITFDGRLFIGRGIKQKKPVVTSSLIFIIKKKYPSDYKNIVKIINYEKYDDEEGIDFKHYLKNYKKSKKSVRQKELLNCISNWNFITKDNKNKLLIDQYNNHSISIEDYRKSLKNYDLIQFDKGLVYEKSKINNNIGWQLINLKKRENYNISLSNCFIEEKYIRFPEGSQGLQLFKNKYKIIWSYMNFDKFFFSDKQLMIDFNWVIISSNDKNQILKLLSLLNSKLTMYIIYSLFKIYNEQALLLGIRAIKEFIRIPKTNTQNNRIVTELINQTQKLLDLENIKLCDLVDFSNVRMQKFDSYKIKRNNLVLMKNNKEYFLNIHDPIKSDCIKKTLDIIYNSNNEIGLSDLRNIFVVDRIKQNSLKEYIDDLVFSLYFNININKININNAEEIKNKCKKNKFYGIITQ